MEGFIGVQNKRSAALLKGTKRNNQKATKIENYYHQRLKTRGEGKPESINLWIIKIIKQIEKISKWLLIEITIPLRNFPTHTAF